MELRVSRGRKEFRDAADRLRNASREAELIELVVDRLREPALAATGGAKQNALTVLPNRGGLAKLAASSKFNINVTTKGRSGGVRIEAKLPGHDLVAMDRGRIRHPVYGNLRVWVSQAINRYWFTTPMLEHSAEMHQAVFDAVDEALERWS